MSLESADAPPESKIPDTVPPSTLLSGPASAAFRLADLLLGAMHVDQHAASTEHDTLRGILCRLLGREVLPARVEQRLRQFDPANFDFDSAVRRYSEKPAAGHRQLLEMVHAVCEADGIVELSENGYMVALVVGLGMDRAHATDLVLMSPFEGVGATVKRVEDVVLACGALALTALPMALIAAAVKGSSRGPALFVQTRYGLDGERIRVFKFRTMKVAEDGDDVRQATKRDPRVTRLGAFLRRTSLDELPQIFNVLRGDMSLVGPRPHAVAHNEKFKLLMPKYMLRHVVKPGITGWAQVNGCRGETDTLDKMIRRVEHDVYYIRHWNPWLDMKILFLTVFGRGVRENAY